MWRYIHKESIVKFSILGSTIVLSISLIGCSSSTELSSKALSKSSKLDNNRSWCQKNYLSASVSMRDKQANAKRCDVRVSQANKEAKEKEINKDIEQ